MKYVIQPAARQDILSIFFYFVDQGAAEAARRFLIAVEQTVNSLIENPEIGIRKDSKIPRLQGLRRWQVIGFEEVQIFYQIQKQMLRIIRILHGKRDTHQILQIRI